jgi:hypothetical protein
VDIQSPTFVSQAMALVLPDYLTRIPGLRALQIGEFSIRLAVADPLGGRASHVERDADSAYRHRNWGNSGRHRWNCHPSTFLSRTFRSSSAA